MNARTISPHRIRVALAAAIALTAAGASATPAHAGDRSFAPDDFQVFIDRPTGFSYVRTPGGWKFVRKLDAVQVQAALELKRQGTPGMTIADVPADPPAPDREGHAARKP